MNVLEFNIFSVIYGCNEPIHLREIVRRSKLSYGTVQAILNKNIKLFDTKISGKNKHFSFRSTTENKFLFIQIEAEKTRDFLKKNNNLIPFIENTLKLDVLIIIFGSFVQGKNTKKSDLDILLIAEKDVELPEHLCPYKIHKIFVKPVNLPVFKKEALYSEIIYNHLIVSNIDHCLNKVFGWN
jgi:predicted nucleotidyltransferase